MANVKGGLIRLASSTLLPRLFSPSPLRGLTTILYHRFFDHSDTIEAGRTKLKKQLEWLRKNYSILDFQETLSQLHHGTLTSSPILVTVDDAKIDLLNVYDIFQEFEIPLTVFVCTGWADNNEPLDKPTRSRIVDFVRWYKGEVLNIDLGKFGSITLAPSTLDVSIDWLISNANEHGDEFVQEVWDVFCLHIPKSRERQTCTWAELVDLYNEEGLTIGSHTVSHCRLAQSSPERLGFELIESKRAIEAHFPECLYFAYPFGTADVVSKATSIALKKHGYKCGLLTHAGFSPNRSDAYVLPRIVIPDIGIGIEEYKARVQGGTIPFEIIKKALGR